MLSHLFQRGVASDDWSGFSPEEQSRLIHILYSFFKTFENIYVHSAEGSVPPEVWERNCQVFFAYASQPGGRRYWNDRRRALDERFVKVLEGMGQPKMPTGLQMADDGSGTT